jgi:hypothetical protein
MLEHYSGKTKYVQKPKAGPVDLGIGAALAKIIL